MTTHTPKPKLSDVITLRAAKITLVAAMISALAAGFGVAIPVYHTLFPPGPTEVNAKVETVTVQQGFTWGQWVSMFPPKFQPSGNPQPQPDSPRNTDTDPGGSHRGPGQSGLLGESKSN